MRQINDVVKNSQANNRIIKILKDGGIGVMPTDTVYGFVRSALSKKTVEKVYKARRRNPEKPFIILIATVEDLNLFRIKIDSYSKKLLSRVWPGMVSVILPCPYKNFEYLHRGTSSLAFRLPKNKGLINLLKKTGPLVAPSANPEGLPPVDNIRDAKKYFGKRIDFYVNQGKIKAMPSTLIQIKNKQILILREGAGKLHFEKL